MPLLPSYSAIWHSKVSRQSFYRDDLSHGFDLKITHPIFKNESLDTQMVLTPISQAAQSILTIRLRLKLRKLRPATQNWKILLAHGIFRSRRGSSSRKWM